MDKLSMITLLLARAYTDKKTSEVPAVIQYKGVTTTALSDGATTNPITINGSSYTAVNGDTVFYNGVAYTFDGTVWQETVSLAQIITALEELEDQVGDLSALTTTDKDSVVDAINELVTAVGDKVDKVEGKGLSTNDYDDTEKQKNADNATAITAIKDGATIDSFADVETALSAKQDALTFDDTPTDGSNNPVKSNGIYDALALKQNATDNSLDTEAKTIVGAINEHEGDISSLKSGLTTLDDEVNGDAITYPYADVITIEDAVPANLADCSVKIEPVQDLHGYDKPWVGGAGKNKANIFAAQKFTYQASESTVTLTEDGNTIRIAVNGATYSGGMIDVQNIANGTYTLSCSWKFNLAGAGCVQVFDSNDTKIYDSYTFTTDGSIHQQITISDNFARIRLFGSWGTTSGDITYSDVQFELSNQATDYEPYENICPISGHTEASVQRDGKNLLDVSTYTSNKYLGASGDEIDAITYAISKFIRVKPSTQYVASGVSSVNGTYMAFYDADKNFLSSMAETADGFAFTTPNNASYVKLSLRNVTLNAPQLEERQTATPYEPYAGKTYTIALGDTIYGGTVDFDSGVMTVDRAYVEYNGSENWGRTDSDLNAWFLKTVTGMVNGKCSLQNNLFDSDTVSMWNKDNNVWGVYGQIHVHPDTNISPSGNTAEGLAEFKTWLSNNHLQVVYPLATPTTIQLTPQQIQLLKGQNTLTASTGQISVTVNGVSGSIGAVQEQVNGLADNFNDVIGWSDRRNLFDAKHVAIEELPNSTGTLQYGCKFDVVAGQKYTVSSNMTESLFLFSKTGTDAAENIFTLTSSKSFSFTAATNTIYYVRNATSTTVNTFRNKLLNGEVQFEEGSVATDYQTFHPIIGNAVDGLIDRVPSAPTTDGAYVLTVTVADGTPTYSWVSGS